MHSIHTIIWDDRENKRLVFPRYLVVLDDSSPPVSRKTRVVELVPFKKRLETGDYLLQGFESRIIVERKGSLDEIAANCLTASGRRKFVAACDRLSSSCDLPHLILEGTPNTLLTARTVTDERIAFDALLRILVERRISLWFMPNSTQSHRRAMGEAVARLLISGSITNASNSLQQSL